MSMVTNLQGRLRNTSLPKIHGLLPVFEAVVNSIHSIEELGLPALEGRISISIIRDRQPDLEYEKDQRKRGPEAVGDIIGFEIRDNGIGFNEVNMRSFETLDTDHKIAQGSRGVGRLLWLKAFEWVDVGSIYLESDGRTYERTFRFERELGVSGDQPKTTPEPRPLQTRVKLDGFKSEYREYSKKTAVAIADHLLEHCLWYFIRKGGAPTIIVLDGGEPVDLHERYDEHMVSSSQIEPIVIKGKRFDLTHIKLRSNTSQSHTISYCASNRVVKDESINGRVPGLYGRITEAEGAFVYTCYVSSDYLDESVRSERTSFTFEDQPDSLFTSEEISLNDIRTSVLQQARSYLEPYLAANRQAGHLRVTQFVNVTAPRYRPILSRLSQDDLSVDPTISDKDLELRLHKKLTEIEGDLLSQGHDLMAPKVGEALDDYQERVQSYLATVSDIKKADLAGYVSHRKVIIDLLAQAIEKDSEGRYLREDVIHKLIMPMGRTSQDLLPDNSNLWLIDERLAFHDYLASDKSLRSMPITGADSGKEPDLLALNIYDNPMLVSEERAAPLASIVVVEIKRPMRNDAASGEDKDPIEQALGYLKRVRDGGVKTATGRPIPGSDSISGFCYVLADLTPSVVERCEMFDAIKTQDGLGYFFHHKKFNAYVEVISFDRIVLMARQRNRAFFDRLGLPAN